MLVKRIFSVCEDINKVKSSTHTEFIECIELSTSKKFNFEEHSFGLDKIIVMYLKGLFFFYSFFEKFLPSLSWPLPHNIKVITKEELLAQCYVHSSIEEAFNVCTLPFQFSELYLKLVEEAQSCVQLLFYIVISWFSNKWIYKI